MTPGVISDAFQQIPGADNAKDSPWEQRPVLRGLSGQRVLVLVDGMPMNSARGNGPHPSLVDANQIERIEIVRGPSSVAYGSDAIGGAINIITRAAQPASQSAEARGMNGHASFGGSSAEDLFGGQVEVRPHADKLSAVLAGGWHDAKDLQSAAGKIHNSAYGDWNGLLGLNYEFSRRLNVSTGYQLYRGNDIGIPGLSFESARRVAGLQVRLLRPRRHARDAGREVQRGQLALELARSRLLPARASQLLLDADAGRFELPLVRADPERLDERTHGSGPLLRPEHDRHAAPGHVQGDEELPVDGRARLRQ
jgi:outer membrane receptor protein involved in Fe transport